MSRFLTPNEKARETARFAERRRDPDAYRTAHPEAQGGEGWIDPEVLPLVDALNAIPGVCTIQSCSGHERDTDGEKWVSDGQLWLRLDKPTMDALDAQVGALLSHGSIMRVTRQYAFHGGNRPHDFLDVRFPGCCVEAVRDVLVPFFRVMANMEPVKSGATNSSYLSGRAGAAQATEDSR